MHTDLLFRVRIPTGRWRSMACYPLWAGFMILVWPAVLAAGERPIVVTPSASYAHKNDGHGGNALLALCDGREPAASDDRRIPRFTFWSHKGTREWVQYDFDTPARVSSVQVYWFDDRPRGGCRVPARWRLLYRSGAEWRPVRTAAGYNIVRDRLNELTFEPVITSALRIEVQHQPGFSGGILEWKIDGQSPRLSKPAAGAGAGAVRRDFDYGPIRLALAILTDTVAGADSELQQALVRLDTLARDLAAVRRLADRGDPRAIDRLDEVDRRLAAFPSQYRPAAILERLNGLEPDACLKLMVQLDWLRQDSAGAAPTGFRELAEKVIEQLGAAGAALARRRDRLAAAAAPSAGPGWMQLYLDACHQRRARRLEPLRDRLRRFIFTKHHDIGGQHYAYTEDVSDSPYNDNNPFPPGGKLCLLEMDGLYGHVVTLLDEPDGLIRDPAVSYDGKRVLFAWRKSMTDDDYHLYEMTLEPGTPPAQADNGEPGGSPAPARGGPRGFQIRQLTFGRGVADYEPAYLPNGDIVFNSSRCQQIVDCWWADVSNLYTCDGDGKYLRRLTFDQVHTNYPTVLPDGRVIYTRWDYNDRGQLFPQPLFQMNPDGTGQREFYGGNSWFPTSILHARGIPGTGKVVCVLSGHHTYQKGKLAIIDPSRGRQEASGVQLIAPVRPTEAVRIDKYGYQGEQFQYPYALSETEFLVTFSVKGSRKGRERAEEPFGVYLMRVDGQRELLAADPKISCNQSVPLAPRPRPPVRPSRVDYRKTTGIYTVQDIYRGAGLKGVARGTIKRLRVVALEFRAAGIGRGGNRGPAGGALVSTPISINGAWDVKRVLGTAKVYEDGSAAFVVPARTPVYFQALDKNNHVVQTMRSWSTLQPGETLSCVGCHETKNTAPAARAAPTEALRAGPQPLEPFPGGPEGFSFRRLLQPILDRHCIQCHNRQAVAKGTSTISLEGRSELDPKSLKYWSDAYKGLADPKLASWVSPQSAPTMLPPYHAGAAKSKLIELLARGHWGVQLSRQELDLVACWIDLGVPYCGDYTEAMAPEHVPTYERYLAKRKRLAAEEARQIEALVKARFGRGTE